MNYLETYFDCAGFCEKNEHYYFSDVNSTDLIVGGCREILNDFLGTWSYIFILISGIVTCYLVLTVIYINIFRYFSDAYYF